MLFSIMVATTFFHIISPCVWPTELMTGHLRKLEPDDLQSTPFLILRECFGLIGLEIEQVCGKTQ